MQSKRQKMLTQLLVERVPCRLAKLVPLDGQVPHPPLDAPAAGRAAGQGALGVLLADGLAPAGVAHPGVARQGLLGHAQLGRLALLRLPRVLDHGLAHHARMGAGLD